MNPLVSIIVPIYNGERHMSEALESVAAQDYAGPVEVIVVDDGSTDSSVDIATSRGLRVIRQQNAGAGAARNTGITAATGDILAFLDQDDLWLPAKLRLQVELLLQHPGSIVLARQSYFLEDGEQLPAWFRRTELFDFEHDGWAPSCLMVERTTFERVGSFDARLRHGSDVDWFSRANHMGVPSQIPAETVVRRRLHGMNDSQNLAAKRELFDICRKAAARNRAASAASS